MQTITQTGVVLIMTDKPELEVDVEEARQELEQLQNIADKLLTRQTQAERDHMAARLRAEEMRCEVYRRQLRNINDDNDGMVHEISNLQTQVENLTEELEQLDSDKTYMLADLDRAEDRIQSLSREVHGLRAHLKGEQRRPKLIIEDVLNIISNESDKQQTLGYAGVATALDGCRQVIEEAFVGILKGVDNG
jgi:DNA repair exonuclease SbcCD ATPase subunit